MQSASTAASASAPPEPDLITTERVSTSGRLDAAVADESQSTPPNHSPSRPNDSAPARRWLQTFGIASAAAVLLAWMAAHEQIGTLLRLPSHASMNDDAKMLLSAHINEELLRDFVAQHSRPLPPEKEDPNQVGQFERYVGVPVHVPVHLTQRAGPTHFVGGRIVPIHGGERAAMLQYEVRPSSDGGVQRVTLFVYDPRKMHVGAPNLARRAVGSTEVHVGQTDGYSVAVTQREGVGYAMASDLDPDTSADLVAAVGGAPTASSHRSAESHLSAEDTAVHP